MFWRGRPRTKQRPRLGRRRKAYTPAATIEFENTIKQAWIDQHPDEEPFEGPVGMSVEIGCDHIEVHVWELEESHRPKFVTGDMDNYQKSIQDALNGTAYKDDKQVHYLDLRLTKETPGYDPRNITRNGDTTRRPDKD